MNQTENKNKGGLFSPLARPVRDLYNWVFHPNVDHYFTDPFWSLTEEKIRREQARKAVARFSRGNIRLQYGKYITREDVNRAREAVQEFIKRDDYKRANGAS
jgi:hypothetical protein